MTIAVTSKSFSKNTHLKQQLLNVFPNVKFNYADKKLTPFETIEFLQDCEGAIVALEEINEWVLSQLPKLKIIAKYGVGLDNIDLNACKKHGVHIGWTGGVNKASVAEMTLGFMLMLSRNLYTTSNQLKEGIWNKSGGSSLYGKTIGIIGVGHIGKEVIQLLKPFGCTILVNDIIDQTPYYSKQNALQCSKEEIFQRSDIITLHTPSTEHTFHLVNAKTLSLMKPTAYIINTARGDIINLHDLKSALQLGSIAGAAIDVYDTEPPQDRELLSLPNLICTPHIGGNAHEAVVAMGESAIIHLKEYFL